MVEDDRSEAMRSGEAQETAPAAEGNPAEQAPTADIQSYISRQLRAIYDDVAKQPIPDRFVTLMQELAQKTSD